ncbi:replication protein P, partial [Candidatus Thiothrix sp. Deng01]
MKQIGNIASSLVSAGAGKNVVELPERKQVDFQGALADWFNEIFPEILMACPKWGLTISGDAMMGAAKRVWLQALADNGITKKSMVARGIKALQDRGQEYLPSPAEFCQLCKEQKSKLPTLAESKLEILVGRKPWSCPFVEYLAGKTGSILHPTTERELRDAAFAIEYRKAVELAETGYFEQDGIQRIKKQEIDSSLQHYFHLKKSFPDLPYADDFISDCRLKGIHLDIANMTVTHDANLVDH